MILDSLKEVTDKLSSTHKTFVEISSNSKEGYALIKMGAGGRRKFKIDETGNIVYGSKFLGNVSTTDEAFKIISDHYNKLATTHSEREVDTGFKESDLRPYIIDKIRKMLMNMETIANLESSVNKGNGLAQKMMGDMVSFDIGKGRDYKCHCDIAINSDNIITIMVNGLRGHNKAPIDMGNPEFDPDTTVTNKVANLVEFISKFDDIIGGIK